MPDEPAVTDDATSPEITVTPLDMPSPDGIGLLSPEVTGLPATLWSGSDQSRLIDLIATTRADGLPAMRDLLVTLVLAEANPPIGAGPEGAFLLARIDKLLDMATLDPAQALVEAADIGRPQFYRRWFDISLLTGTEDRACESLRKQPDLAPTWPARIFCLARNGDWRGAALTLNTARALGDITDEEDALLSRFLDPALSEAADPLPPPSRISPLVFLMRDAIGEGVPTAGLPLAFAHADLRSTAAWRNEVIAAERLVAAGAVSENLLLAAYTRQSPAASGGVWDRAAAVQRLDAALDRGRANDIAAATPDAWAAFGEVGAEAAFARLFAEQLSRVAGAMDADTAALVARIGLLSPGYETIARDPASARHLSDLLVGVATGDAGNVAPPDDPARRGVHYAFAGAPPPDDLVALLPEARLGEALLLAGALLNDGVRTDPTRVRDALAFLRHVGLEDTARRAALQYLLLERRS